MNYHFEALKLLKEWSTALVVVQTGTLALLGSLLQAGKVRESTWLAVALACFVVSMLFAANVLGAIPGLVQDLPQLVERHGDIYRMRNRIGIPLTVLALGEHTFFVAGILSLCTYLWCG